LSHILGDFVKHHPQSLGVVHSDYIFFGWFEKVLVGKEDADVK
jgi:hypothetical protein